MLRRSAPDPRDLSYITYDLTAALVVAGALATGVLVHRRTAPSEGANALSRGERLILALGAAATVIMIGGCLGNGFRGTEYATKPRSAPSAQALNPGADQ
ncbi:hypothetical protein GCM10010249_04060 [Streptomyces roseolilacinus]|uniref:Uncharacterized protein n=1 Tax=Streptomyces roseolilacinus TaxID=66904 RepID=A0A918AV84_9ACTN|nr:hypothetical protein GCM10010249_04060 [Streptomyces roseolilacinus]